MARVKSIFGGRKRLGPGADDGNAMESFTMVARVIAGAIQTKLPHSQSHVYLRCQGNQGKVPSSADYYFNQWIFQNYVLENDVFKSSLNVFSEGRTLLAECHEAPSRWSDLLRCNYYSEVVARFPSHWASG